MKEKLNIGLLYLSLHNQLKKRVGVGRTISRKDFYTILGKHFLIPKNIRVIVIKEMEKRKLIIQEDKDTIKICNYEYDLETDASKFYQSIGLF